MIVTSLSRRTRAVAFLAAFGCLSLSAAPSFASAPMAKISTPGFYRTMIGDFEVTALSDGTTDLPVDHLLQKITAEKVDQELAKAHLVSPLESSFNGYLINTGSKLVLIDTGAGSLFGASLGKLVANLKASGYQPEQIDEIYITHMHPDHVGGIVAGEQIAFPNAIIRADKRESDYWLSDANMAKAPDDRKGFFQGAKLALTPYIAAGKFKPFDGPTELVPGITARPTIGHTPGHTSYFVTSQGQTLEVIGDLIHVAAVQMGDPSITIAFDSDQKAAEAERKKEFAEAAKNGTVIAAAHISFPGLGRLVPNGKGYIWAPINFTQFH